VLCHECYGPLEVWKDTLLMCMRCAQKHWAAQNVETLVLRAALGIMKEPIQERLRQAA
jgi:hypothetical protein